MEAFVGLPKTIFKRVFYVSIYFLQKSASDKMMLVNWHKTGQKKYNVGNPKLVQGIFRVHKIRSSG